MNNKVYRLLRNNKELGPFTADELVQKNLKPFDLIWVDGRSAAWNYPGEMAEFKMYIPNAEEKSFNSFSKQQDIVPAVSASIQAAVSVNDTIIKTEQAKQKPRYKVSAAWSKIQTVTAPACSNVMVAASKKISSPKIVNIHTTQAANIKSLSWEQAWLDWENEKKTGISIRPKTVQTLPVVKEAKINQTKTSSPVLEKKFEQSLDTITNNYIDNILQQKKKSKAFSLGKSSEFILPSLALIVIFSIAYWLMHDTKVASITNALPATLQQAALADNDEQKTADLKTEALKNNHAALVKTHVSNTTNKAADLSKPVIADAKEKMPVHYISNKKNVTQASTNDVIVKKNPEQKTSNNANADVKKQSKQVDPSVINNVPKDVAYNNASTSNNDLSTTENRPVRRRTGIADPSNNTRLNQTAPDFPVIKNANTNSGLNYVSVPEYISMNDGSGDLKIQNVSDVDLDLAVVDVQYYDASGRFRKGETLYLHNLRAGKIITIKTAKDVNASYATAKVSLVSSDANGVYAVGDN